jgi:hypothetical protein
LTIEFLIYKFKALINESSALAIGRFDLRKFKEIATLTSLVLLTDEFYQMS